MGMAKVQYPDDGIDAEWGTLPTLHREWYGDAKLFAGMYGMQARWFSTYPPDSFQRDLRSDLDRVRQPDAARAFSNDELPYQQALLLSVYASRRKRWEFLVDHCGLISVPRAFVVYRGTKLESDTRAVVMALSVDEKEIVVPHLGLSSWSLLEEGAQRDYFDPYPWGVLVRATVPFDKTLLDVLVDDGYFARHGCAEAEIIVGTGWPGDEIIAEAKDVRVRIGRIEYGYKERTQAMDALGIESGR